MLDVTHEAAALRDLAAAEDARRAVQRAEVASRQRPAAEPSDLGIKTLRPTTLADLPPRHISAIDATIEKPLACGDQDADSGGRMAPLRARGGRSDEPSARSGRPSPVSRDRR